MFSRKQETAQTIAERLAAGVVLPAPSAELTLAENTLTKLLEDRKHAQQHAELLQASYGRLIPQPGGTYQKIDGIDIIQAHDKAEALGKAIEDARRRREALRREYGEKASSETIPGCEAIRDAVLDRLDEIEGLLAMFTELNLSAAAAGIHIAHKTARNASQAVRTVHSLRRLVDGKG